MNVNRFFRRVCAIAVFVFPVGMVPLNAVRADVIELKTGQKLEGDVLKDVGGELVVDLGVDIVRIPASQIKSRHAKEESAKPDGEAKSDQHEIYRTADLPVRTIKELSQKFGEGVVLVKTSSGWNAS